MRVPRPPAVVLVVALVAFVGSLSACSRPAGPQAAATDGSQALRSMLDEYVVEFLKRNPATSTYLGGAGLDPTLRDTEGALRDYSAAGLEAEDRWLAITARRLGSIDQDSLDERARIDRDVALAQIRFLLHQHRLRRYQQRALDTYVVEPFRAVDWQVQQRARGDGTEADGARWAPVVRRLRAVPGFLSAAQEQLTAGVRSGNTPDWRMLVRDGLDGSDASARYFAETLPALVTERLDGPSHEQLRTDLRAAATDASAAYRRFRAFLVATFFDAGGTSVKPAFAGDRYAVGDAEYNWALQNNFRLDDTASQLAADAWPAVEATRQQVIDLARRVAAMRGWAVPAEPAAAVRAVLARLSEERPQSDAEMLAWYRATAPRLVEYGRRTGLFAVPADYGLEIVETPPPLRASIDGAAYYPAPPFIGAGVGHFYVTPTQDDADALGGHNRAALAYLTAHEGFPGHDWYFKVLTDARAATAPVRWLTPGAVEDSSSMWQDSLAAEGWGLYAEALLAEPQPGAPDGFYTPEERLYQLQGRLYRDLRVFIDTSLHTGRLSYEQATTLYSETVDFLPGGCDQAGRATGGAKRASCDAAERAIFRYSKWPTQAIAYRLGMDQIRSLRDEAARRLGSRYSPQAFHLAFIRQGTIPPGYFRDALLHELGAADAP